MAVGGKIIPPLVRTDPRWYKCPECGQNLFKIYPGSSCRGILYKCKRCKQILEITIEPLSRK